MEEDGKYYYQTVEERAKGKIRDTGLHRQIDRRRKFR